MIYRIIKLITKSISEVFAPSKCAICDIYIGNSVTYSEFICNRCYDSIPYSPPHREIFNSLLKTMPLDSIYISKATSLYSLELTKNNWLELIHLLKYKKFTKIGTEFGKLLGIRLKSEQFIDYDYVIPVPIHSAKQRERGYNQSDFIAKSVAETLDCKFDNKLIKRNKYTNSQTQFNSQDRKLNISGVFREFNSTSQNKIDSKKILIIDDVLTTGSTANECAKVLISLGANSVDVATIARA